MLREAIALGLVIGSILVVAVPVYIVFRALWKVGSKK
jgi:hypothetical protein